MCCEPRYVEPKVADLGVCRRWWARRPRSAQPLPMASNATGEVDHGIYRDAGRGGVPQAVCLELATGRNVDWLSSLLTLIRSTRPEFCLAVVLASCRSTSSRNSASILSSRAALPIGIDRQPCLATIATTVRCGDSTRNWIEIDMPRPVRSRKYPLSRARTVYSRRPSCAARSTARIAASQETLTRNV